MIGGVSCRRCRFGWVPNSTGAQVYNGLMQEVAVIRPALTAEGVAALQAAR